MDRPDLEELTTHCIRCGFCLEACPTFTETASEMESPRGRIYLVRSAIEGKLAWEDARPHLDRCLGCLSCETACPSGVEYGAILELARDHLGTTVARKALLESTTRPGVLKTNLVLSKLLPGTRTPGFVSRLVSGAAPEADLPIPQQVPSLPPVALVPTRGEVYLLEGCAMRVLFPRVHLATRRLLARLGFKVRETDGGCCGAMHAHSGDLDGAASRAASLARAFSDDIPIVVNSAGCGSTMRDYGHLLGDAAVGARSVDISPFLLENGLLDLLPSAPGLPLTATYHDACHLAHGQGVRDEPRALLEAIPGLTLVPLTEADTCCGSAGTYNVTQPELARRLLERKWSHVEATGADLVALGNPGCHAWMAQASRERCGMPVLHTAELLEAAFLGELRPFVD